MDTSSSPSVSSAQAVNASGASKHRQASDRVDVGSTTTVPRWVPAFTTLLSLIDMTALHRPGLMNRVESLANTLPGVATAVPGISVALGVLLFGLARSLSRGKRQAWRLAMALLAIEAMLHAGQQRHITALLSVALLIAMFRVRERFTSLPDPGTPRRAVAIGAGLFAASFVIGMLAVSLLEDFAHTPLSLRIRATATLQGLVGIPSILTGPTGPYEDVIYFLLLSLGLLTAVTTSYLWLRSSRATHGRSVGDEQLLRGLLSGAGEHDSLSYFAVRPDRSIVASPNRRACVSYRVVGATALAAGDPIGPASQWPDAMVEFLAMAKAHAWTPAVVAASQQGAQLWMRAGELTALEFGDEAILEKDEFSLEGRRMRNVRHAVARAARAGYVIDVARLRDLDAASLLEVRARADTWRMGGDERGFSMAIGRVDGEADPDSVAVRAMLDGELRALLVLVPWGQSGLSLDLMRRHPDSESGINELMVSRLMEAAEQLGIVRVSLNFAVFRDAFERAERIGAGPVARLWGGFVKFASRGSQADSLYRFNAKFEPLWEPRYLLFPSAATLPRVAMAYLVAEGLLAAPNFNLKRRLP